MTIPLDTPASQRQLHALFVVSLSLIKKVGPKNAGLITAEPVLRGAIGPISSVADTLESCNVRRLPTRRMSPLPIKAHPAGATPGELVIACAGVELQGVAGADGEELTRIRRYRRASDRPLCDERAQTGVNVIKRRHSRADDAFAMGQPGDETRAVNYGRSSRIEI